LGPSPASPLVPGLRYLPGYLDSDTHDRLLAEVDSQPWQAVNGERRIQFYGHWYSHAKGGLYRVGDLPRWALDVATRLTQDGLMPWLADQLIATDYEPGQGIFAHVDAPVFEDVIVSISLGSTCIMEFSDGQPGSEREVLLEPRSALVVSGEARHAWRHSIPMRHSDTWMNRVLPRTRRVSLTFRRMRTNPTAQSQV
jgi:alkylated DNA repair dioxygenase AlkB